MSDTLEQYIKIKEYIAFLTGPMGANTRLQNPEMFDNAQQRLIKLRSDAFAEMLSSIPLAGALADRLSEYTSFRDILPANSRDSIVKINETISKTLNEMQEIVDYIPQLYFDTYFFLNGATLDMMNDSVDGAWQTTQRNWIRGSKVVTKDGLPKLVYHGTGNEQFMQFKFDIFPAVYFAENKLYSEWFKNLKGQGSGQMFECYLRILNPMDLTEFKTRLVKYDDFVNYIELKYGFKLPQNKMLQSLSKQENGLWIWRYFRGAPDWLKMIRDDGFFDGISFYENNPSDLLPDGSERVTPAWMVFSANQIKAAKGNMTYSLHSDDIRFKEGGEV